MPTTVQKPQLMSPPLSEICLNGSPVRTSIALFDHDGSRELVVPALLALVEGDPEKSEECRNDGNEVRQKAPGQPRGRRLAQPVGGDDPRLDQHFPGRSTAETPKEHGRHEQAEL